MYKIAIRGWLKHYDFILLDMLSLFIALESAYVFTAYVGLPFTDPHRTSFTVTLIMIDLTVIIAFDALKDVLTRGYMTEIYRTVSHCLLLLSFAFMAVAVRNADVIYPRVMQIWTGVDYAPEILARMEQYSFMRFNLAGLVLADREAKGETVRGVPVVANLDDAADFICRNWVDDVFFFHASLENQTQELMEQCRQMALTIHVYVAIQGVDERKQMINYLAGYEVLTANMNLMDPGDAFLKRSFDVVVGLFGSACALLLLIILGPFIYAASPGPLIFCQERIGENGRKFKMYKIRSMYPDAEERKKAFEKQNSHADGMMFKMDFDPRVIGNRILPDGRQKKGIGAFIRDTSLDEFPQFFNVLKGDMSVVGTRPPTPDEWAKYQYRHRARMSIQPGLTGLWQIQPDKDNMSFEDVVKLDTDYIAHWGIVTDMRIVAATARKVVHSIFRAGKENREEEQVHT